MTRRSHLISVLAAISSLLVAVPAAEAAGVTRHVSPSGLGTGNCTSTDPMSPDGPCNLQYGVETVAQTGDEVIVAPGTYNENDPLSFPFGRSINVHGADGQPMPRIVTTSADGVSINDAGTTLRRVLIEHSGNNRALNAFNVQVVEQVIVQTSGGASACDLGRDDLMRDSVCFNTATGGVGLFVEATSMGTSTANARNVTAVATGAGSTGIQVNVPNQMIDLTLVAKNVIADGATTDVHAQASNTNTVATATLTTSNYVTTLETEGGMPLGVATVTPAAMNQMAPPLFTDAGVGLFHQATGSPTINTGAAVDMMGTADIDGEARTQGVAPDIGADEFEPPATVIPTPTPLTPTPTATENPECAVLRAKLKKAKSKRKKRKIRKRMRALGC